MVKAAVAAGPLLATMATPASACLCTPNSDQATMSSEQIDEGPVCSGPDAPFDALQSADARNANDRGFSCDPMCDAGNNPTDEDE